jgi:hypothetical protein
LRSPRTSGSARVSVERWAWRPPNEDRVRVRSARAIHMLCPPLHGHGRLFPRHRRPPGGRAWRRHTGLTAAELQAIMTVLSAVRTTADEAGRASPPSGPDRQACRSALRYRDPEPGDRRTVAADPDRQAAAAPGPGHQPGRRLSNAATSSARPPVTRFGRGGSLAGETGPKTLPTCGRAQTARHRSRDRHTHHPSSPGSTGGLPGRCRPRTGRPAVSAPPGRATCRAAPGRPAAEHGRMHGAGAVQRRFRRSRAAVAEDRVRLSAAEWTGTSGSGVFG